MFYVGYTGGETAGGGQAGGGTEQCGFMRKIQEKKKLAQSRRNTVYD